MVSVLRGNNDAYAAQPTPRINMTTESGRRPNENGILFITCSQADRLKVLLMGLEWNVKGWEN